MNNTGNAIAVILGVPVLNIEHSTIEEARLVKEAKRCEKMTSRYLNHEYCGQIMGKPAFIIK